MNLPAFCIRRPAFTIVISLVMIIVGIIGFMNLPVRWIPNVSIPEVTIQTTYAGANASLVEQDVTKVLESSLSGVNGIETLASRSRQDQSQISITFKLGQNIDAAVEDIRSSIERVRGDLPKDADTPIVIKANTDASPIMYLSFSDSHLNPQQLSDYIDKYIVPSFQTIDGVGNVDVYGKRVSAMRIALDPAKMAGAKITVDEVTQLLQAQNESIPSGQIRSPDRFYSVVTNTALKTPQQFNDLIIRDTQNQIVRLKDIGEASLSPENTDSAFRVNGKSAIALAITPQSTANPLDVAQHVQNLVKSLQHTLPTGMNVRVDFNIADYIRSSMHSVYEAFFEAVIFVWLIILAFLCSFRATLIPIVTIPVCLISTFGIIYFLGFSINTITLMALVLAIGLVVDDAIVMLENINRHIEEGLKPFAAALKGSKEIIFSIIAMTLTLAAVYAPIGFTPGMLGTLFKEFTFSLAGAVIISGIVALTLSPMMCARLLKGNTMNNRYSHWVNAHLEKLQYKYQSILQYLLERRRWVVGALCIVGLIGFGIYKSLPLELAPAEDQDALYAAVAAPHSASFAYTDQYVRQLEAYFKQIPDIQSDMSIVGMGLPSHAFQYIKLKPKDERTLSLNALLAKMNAEGALIPGVRVNVFPPQPALVEATDSDSGDNVGLVIMTSGDYSKIQHVVPKIMADIKKNPGFIHIDNKLKWDSEQFEVNIDRDVAADLNVSIPTIADAISTLLAGKNVGKTNDEDIVVQLNQSALADPNIFQQIYVRNDIGTMIPLSHLVSVTESSTPEIFHHYDRLRSDTIYVTLAPNYKISKAIAALEKITRADLPEDMKYTFTGEAKSFLDSNAKSIMTFLLALIFIYLVLVAQFESFIDPLIIMLTVPFAVVGALLTLKLFGGTMNIYSNIGLITLIGLIAKHGILITDFANRLRITGKSIQQAVIEAALLRLRPILMTTSAMVLGALPLALGSGPGAESRQQIGLVIVGGLIFGTFFSLVVIPIAYTYLSPFRKITPASIEG